MKTSYILGTVVGASIALGFGLAAYTQHEKRMTEMRISSSLEDRLHALTQSSYPDPSTTLKDSIKITTRRRIIPENDFGVLSTLEAFYYLNVEMKNAKEKDPSEPGFYGNVTMILDPALLPTGNFDRDIVDGIRTGRKVINSEDVRTLVSQRIRNTYQLAAAANDAATIDRGDTDHLAAEFVTYIMQRKEEWSGNPFRSYDQFSNLEVEQYTHFLALHFGMNDREFKRDLAFYARLPIDFKSLKKKEKPKEKTIEDGTPASSAVTIPPTQPTQNPESQKTQAAATQSKPTKTQ